jgi:hypothetical protein
MVTTSPTASPFSLVTTFNVHVVYIARDINDSDARKSISSAIGEVGPRNGRAQKSLDFQGPPLPMAIEMDGGGKGERYELYLLRTASHPPPQS